LTLRIGMCALLLAACATSQEVSRPSAGSEHAISCGYFSWAYCYERARQLCPGGYRTVSESEGIRPKELRVACSSG
jgi:hypothetical protein